MSNKCFCHFNGYEVKDATARRELENLKPFVVTLSGSLTDGIMTADKTYGEVDAAYQAGKSVIFKYISVSLGKVGILINFTEVTKAPLIEGFHATAYADYGGTFKYRYVLDFTQASTTIKTEYEIPYFNLRDHGMYGTAAVSSENFLFDTDSAFITELKAAIMHGSFHVILPIRYNSTIPDEVLTFRATCNGVYMHQEGGTTGWQFMLTGLMETDLVSYIFSMSDIGNNKTGIKVELWKYTAEPWVMD